MCGRLPIPVQYLANMLTDGRRRPNGMRLNGNSGPCGSNMRDAHRWTACAKRKHRRPRRHVGPDDPRNVQDHGLIADYEDRRDPTAHRRAERGGRRESRAAAASPTATGCSTREDGQRPACSAARRSRSPCRWSRSDDGRSYTQGAVAGLSYPSRELQDTMPEIGALLGADPRIAPTRGRRCKALTQKSGSGRPVSTFRRATSCFSTVLAHAVAEPVRTCPLAKAGDRAARWSA